MKARTKQTIIKKTITELEALGIWKKEYATLVEVYAELLESYQTIKVNAGTESFAKRTPAAISMENLRKDILKYSSELGLTPAGYKKIVGEDLKPAKKSKLEAALENFEQQL